MTLSETLTQTWNAVLTEAPQSDGQYHRRIQVVCAWSVHAGIKRPSNARILILETDIRSLRNISLKDETKGYSIEVCKDEAGRMDRATICIQETGYSCQDIFTIFCSDILLHWIPCSNASDSLNALSRRLALWKKFFQRGAQGGLNREEHIGLYGELSFIEESLSIGAASLCIVNAWQAPFGTNQDFLFGTRAVEIKTTTGNEIDKIKITNTRQLDTIGLQYLFLNHYAFDFRNGSGRRLPELVTSLKTTLAEASFEALSLLTDRLLQAGYVEGMPNEFDGWGFTLRKSEVFQVDKGFPRLLESTLPVGISDVSYTLNLSAAIPFLITKSDFWTLAIFSYE
jgi:hypothetical protein